MPPTLEPPPPGRRAALLARLRLPAPGVAGPAVVLIAVALWPAIVPALLPETYGELFFSSFDVPKRLVLVAGAGAACLLFAWRRAPGAREDRLTDPCLAIPLVLALVALVAGLADGVAGDVSAPLAMLAALALAWVTSLVSEPLAALRGLAIATSSLLLAASVYGIAQAAGWDATEVGARQVPVSFFGNTSFAAEFLVAALPLAVYTALRRGARPAERALGVGAGLLGLAYLVLAVSRIDYAAAAAGAGVGVVVWLGLSGRRRLAWGLVSVGALAAVLLGGAFLAAALGDGPSWVGRSDTLAMRAHVWQSTLALIADAPLRITGRPFADAFPAFRDATEYRISLGRLVDTPHQEYLHLAATLGIPALLAALAWMGLLAHRLLRGEGHVLERSVLCASLAGVAVSALASSPLSHPTTLLLPALCVGVAIGLRPRPLRVLRVPGRGVGAAAGAVLLLAALGGPPLAEARSDSFLASGASAVSAGEPTAAARWFDQAAEVDARAFAARYELGRLLRAAGDPAAGVEAFRAALEIRPGSLDCRVNLANALRAAGRGDEARELVEESLALCDWHPLLLSTRAAVAMDDGDHAHALELLTRALPHVADDRFLTCRLEVRRAEVALLIHGERAHDDAIAAVRALVDDGHFHEAGLALESMIQRDGSLLPRGLALGLELASSAPAATRELVIGAEEAARKQPGFYEQAEEVLRRAGDRALATQFNGRRWAIEARAALADGAPARAVRAARKAADRDPSTPHQLLLAKALVESDEPDAAVEAVSQALALGTFDPELARADPSLSRLVGREDFDDLLDRAARRLR